MMAKVIYKGYAKKNDPIFKTGFIISSPKIHLNKKRKGDKK